MGMKVNGTSGLTFPDTTTLASAGQASVRAWVNFNGTGTVAIRAAYNVTSITDNGTGQYAVNFTTALPDANYAVLLSIGSGTGGSSSATSLTGARTTTSTNVTTLTSSGASFDDNANVQVAIFR
jgi:hypothetical protein